MKTDDWRSRLQEAISASGRHMRDISLKADVSPGYLHSILKEGKEPTIGRLMKITDELGVSLFKVLYGFEMTSNEEDLLRAYASMSDLQKKAFLNLAKSHDPNQGRE